MSSRLLNALTCLGCAAWLLALPTRASANPLDLQLNGLGPFTGSETEVVENYRLLTSEIALALSPRTNATGETLGLAGFELYGDVTIVSFHTGRAFFANVTEQERVGNGKPSSAQAVTGFHVRKGLPFSFEVEGHVNYLIGSTMFMVGGDVRYSFLEGHKYIPNVSVRAGVNRLLNAADLDMTTLNLDFTLSKTFALGGVMTLSPMLGYGLLFANVNSSVLDATPDNPNDNRSILQAGGSLYTLPELSLLSNLHHRIFAGLQLQTHIFVIAYQFDLGLIRGGAPLIQNTIKVGLNF